MVDVLPIDEQIRGIIALSLAEDIGSGDVTTDCIIPSDLQLQGQFIAKQAGIVAGLHVAQMTFAACDERIVFKTLIEDGEQVTAGQTVATVVGPGRAILSGERVALNLLQRMSGIATLTFHYSEAIRTTKTKVLDTRKTVPGLRVLDKWAVRLGGGTNHRFGLYDEVLIKENHITAAGGITEAVNRVRANDPQERPIVVEVQNLTELEEVLPLNVTRILLDNMSLPEMKQAVSLTAGRTPLEASGNVNLNTIASIAATGVDYISVGKLTHSVPALDISLLTEYVAN